MQLTQLKCPSCGAGIEINVQDKKTVFCPFCGNQFLIDDGNINIHIQDDATIKREERLADESEREWVSRNSRSYFGIAIFVVVMFLMVIVLMVVVNI